MSLHDLLRTTFLARLSEDHIAASSSMRSSRWRRSRCCPGAHMAASLAFKTAISSTSPYKPPKWESHIALCSSPRCQMLSPLGNYNADRVLSWMNSTLCAGKQSPSAQPCDLRPAFVRSLTPTRRTHRPQPLTPPLRDCLRNIVQSVKPSYSYAAASACST